MPIFRVVEFSVAVTPKGGFVKGETENGESFHLKRLHYDHTAAIIEALKGPNPRYDTDEMVFLCGSVYRPQYAKPLVQTESVDKSIYTELVDDKPTDEDLSDKL